jgi:glycosyltransferase involved in cell wall biosynthesis
MKVSIVIAVYKDIEALKLIVDTLRYQTYKSFEVVIAEDGQDENIKIYINSIRR